MDVYTKHQTLPRAALVLDLLEPSRPAVDRQVLPFVRQHTFSPADFTISENGTCRLHPHLARRLVAELGHIGVVRQIVSELMKRLGHNPPAAIPHRSWAWLAQRRMLASTS